MSDEDNAAARARVRAMMEDVREKVRPAINNIVEGATAAYTGAAEIVEGGITKENETFWQIAGNLFMPMHGVGYDLDQYVRGPEIAALVQLAKAIVTTSKYEDWAAAYAICARLFDDMDGGEELGLSEDFLGVNWHDEGERNTALRKGMQFHRAPKAYQTAIADVVAKLLLSTPDIWTHDGQQLPQPWANTCCVVIFAIASRVRATAGQMH